MDCLIIRVSAGCLPVFINFEVLRPHVHEFGRSQATDGKLVLTLSIAICRNEDGTARFLYHGCMRLGNDGRRGH